MGIGLSRPYSSTFLPQQNDINQKTHYILFQDCTVSALAERLRNLDGFCELSRSLRGCEEFQLDSKLLVILLHLEEFVKQARPPVAAQLNSRAFFEAMERLASLTASLARHGALFLYMCGRDHSHLPEVLPTAVQSLYRCDFPCCQF